VTGPSGKALGRICLGAATAFLLAFGHFACGGSDDQPSGGSGELTEATLVLDYLPNGVHAGIYRAIAAGHYEERGIDLKVITPTSTADTLRLIEAGKADFGLADGIDVATQIDAGRNAKGIMALTQRPAGGLVTLRRDGVETPADLEGETVGVTGVPSDEAVYETIVEDAGGDPDAAKVVTIGFGGVQALRAGRVAAFTGYVPADATAIDRAGQPTRSFLFDEHGGVSYPGLVAFSTAEHIEEAPELMAGFVAATREGYRDALRDPEGAVADLASATNGIDEPLALATFEAYRPLFGGADRFGVFREARITELSEFFVEHDLAEGPVSPERFATNEFAGTGSSSP
jgi:putative hydroxymethylpyrimidine transport system substrate-binding protein